MSKRIYQSILSKDDGTYLGWEPYEDESHPIGDGMKKIEWNKPLPPDINERSYNVTELEEWYNMTYDENGELINIK